MSSWAQQRESIRRAVEAGASPRTSGQGSELPQRAAAALEPTQWAAHASRSVLLPACGQEAGAQPAAGRQLQGA